HGSPADVIPDETQAGPWEPTPKSARARRPANPSEPAGYDVSEFRPALPLTDLALHSLLTLRINERAEHDGPSPQLHLAASRDASLADVIVMVEEAVDQG